MNEMRAALASALTAAGAIWDGSPEWWSDPGALADELLRHLAGAGVCLIPRDDLGTLLDVAALYVNSFSPDEKMSLTERLALQDVEDLMVKHGRSLNFP